MRAQPGTSLGRFLNIMTSHPDPELVGAGAIFIDDIVLPDGQTFMGRLGGGILHALMGAALWGERPGLSAFVGQGLPDGTLEHLRKFMDTRGIISLDIPQARAWQVFEYDGRRHELHRVKDVSVFTAGTGPDDLPEAYKTARAFYLLQDFDGIKTWLERVSGLILWEPNALAMTPGNRHAIHEILSTHMVDIISPNLIEAQAVYGMESPEALIDAMFHDGARIVALRMGDQGSLVASSETHERYQIPPAPARTIIDQTGAGNTFCGAFLSGMMRGKSLPEAGAMATCAASFCLETAGVLSPDQCDHDERNRRYRQILNAI